MLLYCCWWVCLVLTLDHWGDVLIPLSLGLRAWSSHLVWRLERVKGPGKCFIRRHHPPADDDDTQCGVFERSLTNRSLLLHLYMQVMVFSIWNNYIMYVQCLKLLSQTHAKLALNFSLWLPTQIDLTATENIIEDVIKFLCWVLKYFTACGLGADVIMNNIYVTATDCLDTARPIQAAIVL